MPGLFSSRRRAGSNASRSSSMASTSRIPLEYSTTSNAAAAASSAFLRKQTSTTSLSSAAAAAALRSHVTTPEPVGNVQTRRMARRDSISSNGSGSVIMAGRPGLQRRGSSSSMTERTFRSPSPGGRNSLYNDAVSSASDAPPVPVIPQRIPSGHRRSSSLEPAPRVASPTQNRSNGRAMSMDRKTRPPSTSGRRNQRLSDVNEGLEPIDTGINFSRPRSSQPNSPTSPTGPTDKQYTHGTGAWFSEPVTNVRAPRKTAREIALEEKIARIQAAAGKSVRKTHEDTTAQGSFLAQANNAPQPDSSLPLGTYQTADTIVVYDPASRTFISKPNPNPTPRASAQPQSSGPRAPALAPGTYDPHTRTIVPVPEPKTPSRTPVYVQQQSQRSAVDPALEPPPRNPARLSPTSSPTSPRLHNKPSVVREEPEAEEIASQAGSDYTDSGRVFTGPAGPPKSYVPARREQSRSSSLDVPRGALSSLSQDRGASASPSPARSARFSASPVIEARRHDPPARDISPVKSALKHSPASSMRTTSPLANYVGVKSPGSETSDTASQASQDGYSSKRKKSVRVSFDEQPHEIELRTAMATPTTINRSRSPIMDDLDDEDLMRPRPALPTFGSVRKQRVTPEVAEKVTEMAPERHDANNDHAIGGILKNAHDEKSAEPPIPLTVGTTDTAGELSDDSDDLKSPEVEIATKETLKASGSPDMVKDGKPEIQDAAPAESSVAEEAVVPAINLLPPTPGVEDEQRTLTPDAERKPKQRASAEIKVPGSFVRGDENDAELTSAAAAASATIAAITAETKEPVVADNVVADHDVEERSPMLAPIDEDNSDDEFSDAAEDLSELDNGGYASLDAIAVSPVGKTKTQARNLPPPIPETTAVQQALTSEDQPQLPEGKTSGDWGEATAYWSRLSRQQREQIERDHLSSDDERPATTVKKTKKKTVTTAVGPASAAANQDPAAQPPMRKTMRAQPEPAPAATSGETHMRKSMRAGGMAAGTMRTGPSPRPQSVGTANALQSKTLRPASTSGLPSSANGAASIRRQDSDDVTVAQESSYPKIQPKPRAQSKPKSQSQPQPTPIMTAKLSKDIANDSDSESSFRKKKRGSASTVDASGRYNMKRSMRGAAAAAEPVRERRPTSPNPGRRNKGTDSFSIRSLSPTGSLFGRKKRVEEVRQSLRGNDSGYRTTLRSGPPAKASSVRAPSNSSKFRSRFGDSDDEDETPRRGLFRSRFADSDDEDDDVFIPADLTPVRGIPRRKGQADGDSTDLDDEEEDDAERRKDSRNRVKQATPLVPDSADIDKAMEIARQRLGMTNGNNTTVQESNQGGALRNGSMRKSQVPEVPVEPKSKPEELNFTPEKKKRGLMGSILRRNRGGSTASIPTIASGVRSPEAPSTPIAGASPSVTNSPSAAAFSQSPVSPNGKLIRRSSQQQAPRLRRGDSNYSNMTAPPAMGESSINNTSEWPLPPVPRIPDEYSEAGRPVTSDGAGSKVRFDEESVAGPYSARTGKKKKFGLLRKAFGLND